jgi:glucose 1-dehydrogenase
MRIDSEAFAEASARRGDVSVALCARKSSPFIDELAQRLTLGGCRIATLFGDLGELEAPERFVKAAVAQFGGLDAIVSNAGATDPAPLHELSIAQWEGTFAVNCRATWLLARAAFPFLKESAGSLTAVASQSGIFPHRDTGAYGASKAALIMLCRQLSLEWADYGIRVNVVSPGMIRTPMTEAMYRDGEIATRRERVIPLHRIGTPGDVARSILFLADPQNAYVTGVNLVVDGGFTQSILDHVPGLVGKRS